MRPPIRSPDQSQNGSVVGLLAHDDGAVADALLDDPTRLRAQRVDEHRDRRHVRVVDQHPAAEPQARRREPPVEDRIREPVRAVDEHEVERRLLQSRQHLVRRADLEAHARVVDAEAVRLRADARLLARIRSHGDVVRAAGREGERARAGAGLERRHPRPHLALEPPQCGPREPPELVALAVQPGRQRSELVGDRPGHRSIIAACPSGARSSRESEGRTARCWPSCCSTRATRSSASCRRSASSYPNLAAIRGSDRADPGRPERPARARPRAPLVPSARGLQPRVRLVRRRCRGTQPVLTAELAAVGATALLEAIREVDSAIRFYQASSSEIFGEPVETPQTEDDAARAAHALRRREGVRALHHALVPPPLRPARLRGDPLQPRVAAAPARVRAEQDRERGGGDQARAARRGLARRPLRAARLGLRRRLRASDVADAPAGRAGRLRDRDRRAAQRRGARAVRVRPRGARLARVRAHRRVAEAREGRAPRARRRSDARARAARLGAGGLVRGARRAARRRASSSGSRASVSRRRARGRPRRGRVRTRPT